MTMDDDARAVVTDAVIREGIALLALLGMLWVMGPGRMIIPGLLRRGRQAIFGRPDAHGAQAAEFNQQVSRWDHEQAATPHQPPAGQQPCGCG